MVFCPKCGKRFLDAYENPETIEKVDIENNLPECSELPTRESVVSQVVVDNIEAQTTLKEPANQPKKKKFKK